MIIEKTSNKKLRTDSLIELKKLSKSGDMFFSNKIEQGEIDFKSGFNIFSNSEIESIFKKIINKSNVLGLVAKIVGGLRTGDDQKFLKKEADNKDDKKLLRGRNISRYSLKWEQEYVWYRPDLMKVKQAAAPKNSKIFESKEKLFVRMITGNEIIATFDNNGFYLLQDNLILYNGNYDIKYILAFLNSKLAGFIVKNTTSNIAITQSLLKNFPIYKIDFSNLKEKAKHDELVQLSDKMLQLNKELQKLDPIMDDKEYNEKKSEIEKIDKEIDEKVYKLYDLTPEEIKIIEKAK